MDVYLHTFLAMGAIGAAYYAGNYFSKDAAVEDIVGSMLETLESEGYIKTKMDKDGDKELILIEDVIKQLDKS
tara:strand:- start:536 stop:754 length:219 start_codon:yes stop_codon:yes gene_type:complete